MPRPTIGWLGGDLKTVAVGDMTSDGVNSYAYDFQGRPLTVNSTSFIYDAFGRVAEEDSTGSVTHVLYQPDGSRFATIQNGSIQNYFMPMVNGMVEVFNSSGEQYIRHADWLGSSRLATDGNGNAVYSVAHAPYGETYAEKGTLSRFFTGQTQDVIQGPTGIYDFLFREYTAGGGRWMVPDPAGLAAVDPTNPQTWNRYAYVGNNPLSNVDGLGLIIKPPPPSNPPSLWDIWGNVWQVIGGIFRFQYQVEPPDRAATEDTGYKISVDVSSTFQKGKLKLTNPFAQLQSLYCAVTPSGRSTSLSYAFGGIGAVNGEVDMVVNYNSGQTSLFATGGGAVGWNGGVSFTGTTGLIFGMDGTNNGFSGQFKGGNLYVPTPVPLVGAGGSITHGGGVTVVSAGAGAALVGRYSGGGTWTNTTQPLNIGRFTGFDPVDYLGYLSRLPCD